MSEKSGAVAYVEADDISEKMGKPKCTIPRGAVEVTCTPANDYDEEAQFFDEVEGGTHYVSMSFWGAVLVEVKTQIGIGVLSIPFLFQVVGMVPGVILFTFISVSITWADYMVASIKRRHPNVYSIDDLGQILAGRFGKEYFGGALIIYYVTCSGSSILGLSIALNAMTTHGTCTATFVIVSALLVGAFASIQTLNRLSFISWAGAISVFAAVFTIMIATSIQDRPADAPQEGPWDKNLLIVNTPTFAQVGSTLGGMIFTVACTPAFFSIYSEMREPRKFERTVLISMGLVTVVDIIVGVVVYYYCGQYVASPSPGSAGVLMKKVAYGIAFPGVAVSAILLTHFPAKYLFVRLLRGSPHLSQNSWQHWVVWLSCTGGCTLVAYIVASGIPIFSALSSLIGSFFGPAVSLQPVGLFWLYDNWDRRYTDKSIKFRLQFLWAAFVVLCAFFLQIAGSYGSVTDIISGFKTGAIGKPWACTDNSNSV